MASAISVFPMQNYQDIEIDEARDNKKTPGYTTEDLNTAGSEEGRDNERHGDQHKRPEDTQRFKPLFPFIFHAARITLITRANRFA